MKRASSPFALLLAICIATFGAGAAFAAGVEPGKATPVQREQAQQRFLKGKTLFAQKKYDPALAEFRASIEIVESPNTRLYAARCLREMGKLVDAYVEFGRTAVEANELSPEDPRYKKAGESATAERSELAAKLGFVTIGLEHATDETKLTVAGEEVKRAGWSEPLPVMPGTTAIVVETPGKPKVEKTITVEAGATASLSIDVDEGATPAAPTTIATTTTTATDATTTEGRSGLRPYAYVAGAIGAVGLVTFVVAGAMANHVYSDLSDACGGGACPPSRSDDVARGKRDQTIANVGLVVSIVGFAAGVTLFVISAPKKKDGEGASAAVSITPSGLRLAGAF